MHWFERLQQRRDSGDHACACGGLGESTTCGVSVCEDCVGQIFAVYRDPHAYAFLPRLWPCSSGDHLYFVGGGGLVKVGRAADPVRRLAHLQTGSPVELTLLAVAREHGPCEKFVHQLLASRRTKREWFELDAPLEQAIADVARGKSVSLAFVDRGLAVEGYDGVIRSEP